MSKTLFEKIIAGELPATVVFRDSQVIAFLDIRPAAPVHILIAPNKPIPFPFREGRLLWSDWRERSRASS